MSTFTILSNEHTWALYLDGFLVHSQQHGDDIGALGLSLAVRFEGVARFGTLKELDGAAVPGNITEAVEGPTHEAEA